MKIIKVVLTEEESKDILTTALESGAIGYWANVIRVTRDGEANVIHMLIEASPTGNDNDMVNYSIGTNTIQHGVDNLLAEGFNISDRVRESLLADDVDSDCADCIIQAALFNDLVYG
jgi:hypothetical protein